MRAEDGTLFHFLESLLNSRKNKGFSKRIGIVGKEQIRGFKMIYDFPFNLHFTKKENFSSQFPDFQKFRSLLLSSQNSQVSQPNHRKKSLRLMPLPRALLASIASRAFLSIPFTTGNTANVRRKDFSSPPSPHFSLEQRACSMFPSGKNRSRKRIENTKYENVKRDTPRISHRS